MKKLLNLISLLVLSLSALAQTPTLSYYRVSTLPNSTTLVMSVYSDGHMEIGNSLPSGAVSIRKGGRIQRPYAPEIKRVFNPGQFGSNQFYSPTFKFALDFNPGGLSVAQRKAQGVNLFNFWSLSAQDKAALPFGDGMIYLTESSFHQELEGAGFYECTLAQYEAKVYGTLPSCGYGADPGVKFLVFNIEQSNGWGRGNYGANSHWPSWESKKTLRIQCESDGVWRTLEEIDQQNLWDVETAVRRANRRIILHKAARLKGKPGLLTSDGSSMYQGPPRKDFADNSHGIFLDGAANVSFIGGSNGTITLNGRTYTGVSGSHWSQEDVMDGYYYLFDKDMASSDYQAIFVNKIDSTQNYPYLWKKIRTRHITAEEKGYLQLNRKRMINRQGVTRPILRQIEPQYEGDGMGLYTGNTFSSYVSSLRIPFSDLQPGVTGDGEPPKIWQEPYLNYSRYIVTRFFAGNEPGWGFYVFPPGNPNWVNKSLTETPVFNHHLHSLSSLYQARADLQPYEAWFSGSTLVEDPEVQLNATGSFSAYTGTDAYNYSDGVTGTQKPAYMLRYKATTDGWRVVIVGGMNQGFTEERTDVIQVPGGGLNGNKFKVKLRGPAAQVVEFAVKSSDSNQTYEALFNGNTNWEKPGYAGRIGVANSTTATTPESVTTTTVTIPAFSQTIPYSEAAKSDFLSSSGDGSHHYNTFITNDDYADYTITGAPVTDNTYTLTFQYSTNYSCSGCGTGQYIVNGGSPVSFPMDGADGGVRTPTFTGISLNAGTNTIRFRGTNSASTYFQRFITVARPSSTTTISTTVTSGTACSYTLTTANQSLTTCAASFTLSASTSGSNATGLSFNWARSGFSATGQTVATVAPSVSGTYNYTVTAGKLGCPNKTAVATITVSGCASNSLVALGLNPNFTAPADQGWNVTTTREKYIESTALKIGFLRGGAVISYGALKANNRNLINSNQVFYNDDPTDFRFNTSTDDLGRQIMFFSDYCSPGPNGNGGQGLILKNGKTTFTGYNGFRYNTGGNPVQGGSLYPALDLSPILSSAIYTHPTRGVEFYAKMRPMIWGVKGEPGWIIGEQWCWFPLPNTFPNVLAYHARHTVEARDPARFDEQRDFESLSQENPCIYLVAPLTQKLIDLPGESRKDIYAGNGDSPKYFTSTCKIGAYEGNGGTGVTYYSPMNSQVGAFTTFAGTGSASGDWSSDPTSYIQGAPKMNYDNPGVYEDYGYIIFGTEAEANAAIAALPGIDQSFDFDFSKENMRWYNNGGPLIHEPAGWTLYFPQRTDNGHTNVGGRMMAPARAWQASSLTTINFEMAVSGATSLNLEWQKPGLTYLNQYQKNFPVTGDGQFRTYSVSTADPNFNGIISSVGFSAGPNTPPNSKVIVRRVWKN